MLTEVSDVVACLVEGSPVELQADDGEDDDGKEEEKSDVDQRANGFGNGRHHHLQTCGRKCGNIKFSPPVKNKKDCSKIVSDFAHKSTAAVGFNGNLV